MNISEEHKIYAHYLSQLLGLKHDFDIADMTKDDWKIGRRDPDKIIGSNAIYYLWKNIYIKDLEELDLNDWKSKFEKEICAI